jgi:integrase
MRRGELLGLCWRHIDFDAARLGVEQRASPDQGWRDLRTAEVQAQRTVALDAATLEALRHHRETQQLERDLAGDAYDDQDLVFCDELGRPIYPERLTGWFSKHRAAAGLASGSLHILRHTHITLALTASRPVPLRVVAGRVGDDPKTLLATYAHLLAHSDAEAAEMVADAIDGRVEAVA